jgi:hypothetical protein
MAPNFQLSFPLPRQPSASPNTATPASECSYKSRYDDSPHLYPGSKAERTLGASEPELPEAKKKESNKLKRKLRKSPSFMSLSLSEIDGDPVHVTDGFPFPSMLPLGEASTQPMQHFSRQGSSPLLGELYYNESTHAENLNIATAPEARRTDSLSTLQSHYDSAKVPHAVSQQTSASSARDMALRKHSIPITSPLGFRKVDRFKATEPDLPHSRNVSGDSKVSAATKISGDSIKWITGMPRRRPSVTDPPTLYPNANRAASHAVSPPPALMNTSSPQILPSNDPPKRPKWWQRKTSSPKVSFPTPLEDPPSLTNLFEEKVKSIKVNVKKPKQGGSGARNWFDDLEEDEQTLEDLQHQEHIEHPIHEKPEPPLARHDIISQEVHPATTLRKSSSSNTTQQPTSSGRRLSIRLEFSPQQLSTTPSSPPNVPRSIRSSPHGKNIRSLKIDKSVHLGMDLQVESFLELSSSEDEGGQSSAHSNMHEPYRRHHIRASVERASNSHEVSMDGAQGGQPVRPPPIAKKTSFGPLSKRSTSSEIVPLVPRIPDRPIKLVQRSSSMRLREMMDDKAGSIESTIDSGASSLTDNTNGREGHTTRTKQKSSVRGSKLMKVTSEEEKLLEAMRDKRASIRQDDFEKGFKTAMQLQDIVARPKTAGADGRTSRLSVCGSRSPISSIVTNARPSAAADDWLLEDSFPFPKVPPRRGILPNLKISQGFMSPPKASPSLSFSPSDILPSTPASRNSPITPPAQGSLGVYGRGRTLSPSRGVIVMNNLGHDRKRTTSSSEVMLDGVEQHARELNEADEINGWVLNRW